MDRHETVTPPMGGLLHKHRNAVGELVRFGIVGATNTALDFAVYVWLTRAYPFWAEHFLLANVVSFSVGVVSSFLLNNYWTFRRDHGGLPMRFGKFFAVVLSALVLNSWILAMLTWLGQHDIVAKLVATGLVAVYNFWAYRWWAFKK